MLWPAVLLPPNETLSLEFSVTVPVEQKPSTPHWKRNSKQDALYVVSDTTRLNDPLILPPLLARVDYRLEGTPLRLQRAAEYLDRDPFKGTRKIPLLVVPPVSIEATPPLQLVSLPSLGSTRQLQVKLVNNTPGALTGILSLNSPAGLDMHTQSSAS